MDPESRGQQSAGCSPCRHRRNGGSGQGQSLNVRAALEWHLHPDRPRLGDIGLPEKGNNEDDALQLAV